MSELNNKKQNNAVGGSNRNSSGSGSRRNSSNVRSAASSNRTRSASTANRSNKSRSQKRDTEDTIRKGLKSTSGFMWGLLVNIIIAFFIVKLFSTAFNFGYDIFSDNAFHPGKAEYMVVEIPADCSIMEVGKILQDEGIIESKYVFFAKVKIKGYGNLMRSGKFGLSASMTYSEIFEKICKLPTDTEDEKK